MKKADFIKVVNEIIDLLSENNIKQISISEILEIFLDNLVTDSDCEKVKLLLKKMIVYNSSITEQSKIAAKIETLCSKYK